MTKTPTQTQSSRARSGVTIHPTADVSDRAQIGTGTRIWHQAQVREDAVLGEECIVGKGSYIDFGVRIGNRCKLQNGVFVYHGFDVEDGVFLGPGVMLLNDLNPRAVNPDGSLKTGEDWQVAKGVIREGASVGGGAVVLPGVTVGRHALVGAGAVVTANVPDQGLVYGNPARLHGQVCVCGRPFRTEDVSCAACGRPKP
jgi:UDP-2-acetamido-3-amino-2,3-dideoxy-glucuronate N-acetyltransferase